MTFHEVVEDIKKLVGLDLHSIRPGADIRILEVDEERSCLILRTAAGVTRSRPLGELQTIWNEMNRLPAVHVDEVLHGSGTSRNQPETILANLPYVEWLKLNNKKHIAFIGKNTHPYGTLRQMDSIEASNLKLAGTKGGEFKSKVVVVSKNAADAITAIQGLLPGMVRTLSQGVYTFEGTNIDATIVSASVVPLAPGSYPVVQSVPLTATKLVTITDKEYYVFDSNNVKLLIEK